MIIASTNIFAYDDNMQSLPRMKYDEFIGSGKIMTMSGCGSV